jgi:2-methylcitrate dehydratase PrpD
VAGTEIEAVSLGPSAAGPGLTRRIAEFAAATRFDELPSQVVDGAKTAILDTFGVALAATRLELGRLIVDHVRGLGGTPASRVIGSDIRTAAPAAALANGTLAHGLDFDDKGHVSTYTLPAVLAVGEIVGAPGPRVLEAYVVAREISFRLIDVIETKRASQGGPTYRGWYRVGGVGPIGAAVGAAKVLELGASGIAQAVGLAASSSTGLRRNQGTMARALHAGNGAMLGVHAALLARDGFTADAEILEAPLGLLNLLCLPGECDPSRLTDRLGAPFELAAGPRIKAFPSCAPSHRPLAAILALKAAHDFGHEDIESIEADLHEFSLFRSDTTEEAAAGFSLPYLLAAAVVEGGLGVAQILESTRPDPRIRSLMDRVHNLAEPAGGGAERVVVRLRDGRALSHEVSDAPTFTGEAIERKFRECASLALPSDRVEWLREQVLSLESQPDIRTLMATAAG